MEKIGTAQDARQLIENYVEGECNKCEEVSAELCSRWRSLGVLGFGLEGVVTPEEATALRSKGFSDPFIQELTRDHGRAALKQRVKWLGEKVFEFLLYGDPGDDARSNLMRELAAIGEEAKEYIFCGLENGDPSIRRAATVGLGNLDPEKYPVRRHLQEMLKDKDQAVRVAAAETLGTLGTNASHIFFDLVQLLKAEQKNPDLQLTIIQTLAKIEPDKAMLAQVIVPYLGSEPMGGDDTILYLTVDCGIQALPPLLKMLGDPAINKWQQGKAAEALGKIAERFGEGERKGPLWERGFRILTERAKDGTENTYVRAQALRSLGFFPKAIDLLWDTLGNSDPEIREASAEALSHFVRGGIGIPVKFFQKLNSPNWQERHGALLVLKFLDLRVAAFLLPDVLPLTVDEEAVVAREADKVVEMFVFPHRENFPRLKELLSHPKRKVRQIAARKLGEIFGEEVRRATTATSRGGAPAFNPAEAIATSLRVLNNQ